MRVDSLCRQVVAIANDPGKLNGQVSAFRYPRNVVRHDTDLRPQVLRRSGRDEGEGYAIDLGVLRIEEALLVRHITIPTQRPTDNLLAEQLRAESSNAKDVGDGR